MNSLRSWYRHPEFQLGFREMMAVAPGLSAWGLMTGVAMVKSGMNAVESVAMTLLVFAGSSQLAAIPLIASGAPILVILSTGFCVNLRFVVFSAHLRPYLMHLPRPVRLLVGYLTVDLSYVMFTRRFSAPPQGAAQKQAQLAYLVGGCVSNWLSWQGASLVGIALAHSVPMQWGLGFAGILALVGVCCSLASSRLRLASAGIAAAAAVAAFAMPFKLGIVVGIAAAVGLCLMIEEYTPASRRIS